MITWGSLPILVDLKRNKRIMFAFLTFACSKMCAEQKAHQESSCIETKNGHFEHKLVWINKLITKSVRY